MISRMGSQHGKTIKLDTGYSSMVRQRYPTRISIFKISLLENGHWIIGAAYQNVGGFRSSEADLDKVPTEGWLYNDGTKWNDNDTTITVQGNETL